MELFFHFFGYPSTHQPASIHGIYLGQTMNNIVEHSTIIELLHEAISFVIQPLIVSLDSQLFVLHLNGVYAIRDPSLLKKLLGFHVFERQFHHIEYQHISINLNTLANTLVY